MLTKLWNGSIRETFTKPYARDHGSRSRLEVERFPRNRNCEPRFLRNRTTSIPVILDKYEGHSLGFVKKYVYTVVV